MRAPPDEIVNLLPHLVGHEETLLSLVTDYASIVRGRKLRSAREAVQFL